jgi:hypothetical protein
MFDILNLTYDGILNPVSCVLHLVRNLGIKKAPNAHKPLLKRED